MYPTRYCVYDKFSHALPISNSSKIDLVIFEVIIYVLKTEFKLTYKELTKITMRAVDTIHRHNNELDTIAKIYDVPMKLINDILEYATMRIMDYIDGAKNVS